MGIFWGALAGAFLAPFLYGLYWKKITKAAIAVAYIWGCCLMIVQLLISLETLHVSGSFLGFIFTNSLYSGVFAMVSSLIIVPIISVLTPQTKPEDLEQKFACYDQKVEVRAATVLSDRKDSPRK